jgi:hypothetical protein
MPQKHLVTCPQCGFHVSDQGNATNPGLTGDIREFTHTCQRTAAVLNSPADEPFGCPELLSAVHGAAPSSEAAGPEFISENGGGPGVRLRKG